MGSTVTTSELQVAEIARSYMSGALTAEEARAKALALWACYPELPPRRFLTAALCAVELVSPGIPSIGPEDIQRLLTEPDEGPFNVDVAWIDRAEDEMCGSLNERALRYVEDGLGIVSTVAVPLGSGDECRLDYHWRSPTPGWTVRATTSANPDFVLAQLVERASVSDRELAWLADGVTPPTWGAELSRIDDNGNEFAVARYTTVEAAEARARAFEAHGHKQTYVVRSVPANPRPQGR